MNQDVKRWTSMICGSLAALGMTIGCATVQPTARVGSKDVVADRQRLMQLNNESWKDIQAKAKANDIGAIAVNAETIAVNAMHIPVLFPQGSVAEKSRAKPEIWQKWTEFETDAKNLQMMAEQLRDTAKAKNADATQAIVRDFQKQTCDTCHTPFRAPPRRS